jgi:hypothetical protein
MKKKITGKDLTKEAPRSPRIRVGGYAILGRTIDKCRALVAGNIGEYHFDCPLDNMVFGFKGVKGDDFKAQIEQGAGDQEIVEWLNQAGEEKTPDEIKCWADEVEASSLTIIPKSRSSSAKRSRNSDSIRRKRPRLSGWKWTIEFPTRSKRRRELSRWIGFSGRRWEASPKAQNQSQATESHLFYQRIEDNAFHPRSTS